MVSTRNRIQICEDKFICACWCPRVHPCKRMRACARYWPANTAERPQARNPVMGMLMVTLDGNYEVGSKVWQDWVHVEVHGTSDCTSWVCLYFARIPRLAMRWSEELETRGCQGRFSILCVESVYFPGKMLKLDLAKPRKVARNRHQSSTLA